MRSNLKFARLDDDRLASAAKLIAEMVQGQVIAPNEPWIREYLGIPGAEEEAAEAQ